MLVKEAHIDGFENILRMQLGSAAAHSLAVKGHIQFQPTSMLLSLTVDYAQGFLTILFGLLSAAASNKYAPEDSKCGSWKIGK
jgi:hypothetical protein